MIKRESELASVDKRVADIHVKEHDSLMILDSVGRWIENPERPLDRARLDAADAEKPVFEERVAEAEHALNRYLAVSADACVGGKLVFIDLAGSEYFHTTLAAAPQIAKQTPQEKQQLRQINADLCVLKDVIRARAEGAARVPYRSSPLTMLLRGYLDGSSGAETKMILNVASSDSRFAATMSTLRCGDVVSGR